MLKKNWWRKDNSIQTEGKLEKKEKLEEKWGGDGTNNRGPLFHRHSSVEKFQMKKLSINGLVLIANKNIYQKLCGEHIPKLCGDLCRNKDTVYD